MPSIIYITAQGDRHEVDVAEGTSVMQGAVQNAIPGIDGDCGGSCACATCHVHVAENWTDQLHPIEAEQEDMLDQAFDVRDNSRLSCQLLMSEELDGLEVTLAPGTEAKDRAAA